MSKGARGDKLSQMDCKKRRGWREQYLKLRQRLLFDEGFRIRVENVGHGAARNTVEDKEGLGSRCSLLNLNCFGRDAAIELRTI